MRRSPLPLKNKECSQRNYKGIMKKKFYFNIITKDGKLTTFYVVTTNQQRATNEVKAMFPNAKQIEFQGFK